ncbi:hypothetical protein [Oceanobacillus salinisoli]|uniref:hypothetical protein n=1 Tax=Oceanobacillus salinisoli TaxID=2678611 RepID=UPI0012E197C0|nr:hypothetical protein [Oceanobacillus salinisoli]
MKVNQKVILVISIITFVIAANYFIEPIEREDDTKEDDDSEEVSKLKRELNQLHIDHYNLEAENQILERQKGQLEDTVFELRFELRKNWIDTGEIIDYLPFPESTKILFKDYGEASYIMLYQDETWNNLVKWHGDPEHYYLGGVITDSHMKQVHVWLNEHVYEATIVPVNNDYFVWYSIFEYESKSTSANRDMIKMEAMDEDGNILWEEAFEADLASFY